MLLTRKNKSRKREKNTLQSALHICVDSISMDSISRGLKIVFKKSRKFQKTKLEFVSLQQLRAIYVAFIFSIQLIS